MNQDALLHEFDLILKELQYWPTDATVLETKCPICIDLGEGIVVDRLKNEQLPIAAVQLEDIIWYESYAHDILKRCPKCGTLYLYEYKSPTEYRVNPVEQETLSRTDLVGAKKRLQTLLEYLPLKLFFKEDGIWKIDL